MIAPVEQYIIDQVRTIRRHLGMSAEQLSFKVSPSGSGGLIGNIESAAQPATYTDHNLNIIAKVFTDAASLLEKAPVQSYTVLDFYPPSPLDDKWIIKNAVKIPLGPGPTLYLNKILNDSNFLDEPKSLLQIVERVNKEHNQNFLITTLSSTVSYAEVKRLIERVYVNENQVLYRKIQAAVEPDTVV